MLQRRILDKLGYEDVDIVTLGSKSEHGGLGTMFALVAWDGFVCHDLLFKMLLRTRPYEINQGESEALFEKYLQQADATDARASRRRMESQQARGDD